MSVETSPICDFKFSRSSTFIPISEAFALSSKRCPKKSWRSSFLSSSLYPSIFSIFSTESQSSLINIDTAFCALMTFPLCRNESISLSLKRVLILSCPAGNGVNSEFMAIILCKCLLEVVDGLVDLFYYLVGEFSALFDGVEDVLAITFDE